MLNYKEFETDCQSQQMAQQLRAPREGVPQLLPPFRPLTDTVGGFEDPIAGWESKEARRVVSDAWVTFISDLAPWRNFWTLTFEDEKAPDVAKSLFRWLVRSLNTDLLGRNYVNKVGHSYFSYVVGMEKQTRDVVHFHVLADQPINYVLLHSLWGERCGYAWVDGQLKDKEKVTKYVCKYVLKGGEIDQFKRKREFWPPMPAPSWWPGLDFSEAVRGKVSR